jgi:hypothetical protein
MNAWTKTSGISFVLTNGIGEVRISRGAGGYWSYLGTDILHVSKDRQTMNLEGFTMHTNESKYRQVVRHETGHTLGCPHEHMRKDLVARIDPEKAYKWFWEKYGWDKDTVDDQVLKPLDEESLMGTPADQTSIMCYQLPGIITTDGQPILGGNDINEIDYEFIVLTPARRSWMRIGPNRAPNRTRTAAGPRADEPGLSLPSEGNLTRSGDKSFADDLIARLKLLKGKRTESDRSPTG